MPAQFEMFLLIVRTTFGNVQGLRVSRHWRFATFFWPSLLHSSPPNLCNPKLVLRVPETIDHPRVHNCDFHMNWLNQTLDDSCRPSLSRSLQLLSSARQDKCELWQQYPRLFLF